MTFPPIPETFNDKLQNYQPQVAAISKQGLVLLQEAREALPYYESMPVHLTHQQAHDAANLLRMRIIPELESSFEDVFKSFTADVPSAYREGMDPALAEYKFEDGISRATAVIAEHRAMLDSLPARERSA